MRNSNNRQINRYTSSNHRLESAALNALEELLFKMLGMSGEDSRRAFSAKEIGYLEDHFIESVTENWRYFRFSPWTLFRLVLLS